MTAADPEVLLNIVVVTYHSSEKARTSAERYVSLMNDFHLDASICWTIVDNSEDSSDAEYYRSNTPESQSIVVLDRPQNIGFAAGCNLGVEQNPSARWVLLANPDLIIKNSDLTFLIARLRELDSSDDIASASIAQNTNGFIHQGVTFTTNGWFRDRKFPSSEPLYGPSGGAGLFRARTYRHYRGLDEEMFAWGEDADLAFRMNSAGEQCVPIDIVLDHLGGHSISGDSKLTIRKARLLLGNRFTIAARYYGRATAFRFSILVTIVTILRMPRYIANRGVGTVLRVYAQGMRSLWGPSQ